MPERDKLLVANLDSEVVVYDPDSNIAHSLTGLATVVWQHHDSVGNRRQMLELTSRELQTHVDDDALDSALEELITAGLVAAVPPALRNGPSRREVLVRGAGLGIAAVSTPLITTVLVPTAAAAATGGAPGAPCTPGAGSCPSGYECRPTSCNYAIGFCEPVACVGKTAAICQFASQSPACGSPGSDCRCEEGYLAQTTGCPGPYYVCARLTCGEQTCGYGYPDECPNGEVCVLLTASTGVCQPPTCDVSKPCPAGFHCSSKTGAGNCMCDGDLSCPGGRCDLTTGHCVSQTCTLDSDCVHGNVCLKSACCGGGGIASGQGYCGVRC